VKNRTFGQVTRYFSMRNASLAALTAALGLALSTTALADLRFSPKAVDFGNVIVGTTSKTRLVALVNIGDYPARLGKIRIRGDFAQTNECPTEIPRGEGCNFEVTFSPTTVGPASGEMKIQGAEFPLQHSGTGITGVAAMNCSNATASDPNLTELFPLLFLPENIKGVTGPRGNVAVSITGINQDKPVTGGLLLCQDAFIIGNTAFLRDDDGPGRGGRSYEIGFKATDKSNAAASCTGTVPVCVQDFSNAGKACTPTMESFVSASCPAPVRRAK
jgi:hypothetical protein